MHRNLYLTIAGFGLLAGSLALADAATCTMGSLERSVAVHYDSPGAAVPCEVRYSKPTEGAPEETLWRAENEEGYCEARYNEFIDKLRGFGWSCGGGSAGAADPAAVEIEPSAAQSVAPAPADEPADDISTEPAESNSADVSDTER